MLRTIRKRLGKSVLIGRTFLATGLYFFFCPARTWGGGGEELEGDGATSAISIANDERGEREIEEW